MHWRPLLSVIASGGDIVAFQRRDRPEVRYGRRQDPLVAAVPRDFGGFAEERPGSFVVEPPIS